MAKWIFLFIFMIALAHADTGFNIPNVLVSETDGNPRRRPIQELEFSTGTVTISGTKATVVTGGGSGGGMTEGSTFYIQNTLTPTTTTQVFSVQQGSFSVVGFGMVDSAGCKWTTTIATTGALVTTLGSCPSVVTSRPCSRGQSLGLLLSITCSETLP